MAEYKYSTLQTDRTNIRLLRLLPSIETGSTIKCEISTVCLSPPEKAVPFYEALSYTWGDASDTVDIEVNGCVFQVTRNLGSALQALRQAQTPRVLWVDAISINQADLQECASQVRIMWDIYSNASCVVVWLGPEEGESSLAIENFKKGDARMKNEMRNYRRPRPVGFKGRDWCGCHAGEWQSFPSRLGVQKLLERKWFTRVWVLQEVAAAKKVLVVCGKQEVSGIDFCLDVQNVAAAHPSIAKLMRTVQPAVEFMNPSSITFRQQSLPLLELIETFRSWESTKKVDKVYSLLSFSSDAYEEPALRPDYTLPTELLAKRIVKFSFPTCSIKPVTSDRSEELVTFDIDVLMLGTVKEKWSQRGNRRSWLFDATKTTDKLGACGFSITPSVAKIFEESWQINILTTRRLKVNDIVCLLRGASRPSVLRFENGQYTVVMLATPEPTMREEEVGIHRGSYKLSVQDVDRFLQKKAGPEIPQRSWTDIIAILATESAGRQRLTLSWNPFQMPTEDQTSMFRPSINHPYIQWEARLESIYDTAKNEAESVTYSPQKAHNCQTITMLRIMYMQANDAIKAGTSKYNISLQSAAQANWAGTVKLLLDANAEIDGRDMNDTTALCYAAALNHVNIVAILLEAGASVDIKSPQGSFGITPLSIAAGKDHLEICQLLLQAGANPNAADHESCLFAPAVKGSVEIIRVLLKAGANPGPTTACGPEANVTPLCLAAELGHLEVVRELLAGGAPVDAETSSGTRAIHQAAMNGHTEIVRLLLSGGANVNARNKQGVTPLDFAVFRKKFDTAQEIQKAGGIQNRTC